MTDTDTNHRSEQPGGQCDSDNWLAWLDNPTPADLEWLAKRAARDQRVGSLLRALHYVDSADAPKAWNPQRQSEDDYWVSRAQMAPGYTVEDLDIALARRRDPSIPVPKFGARRSAESQLRHDVLMLYEVGIQRSSELAQGDATPSSAYCESELLEYLQQRINDARDWRPADNALAIAVNSLVKRTLSQRHADRP